MLKVYKISLLVQTDQDPAKWICSAVDDQLEDGEELLKYMSKETTFTAELDIYDDKQENTMFITLTDLNGGQIEVNPTWIQLLQPSGSNTKVMLQGYEIFVTESRDKIKELAVAV